MYVYFINTYIVLRMAVARVQKLQGLTKSRAWIAILTRQKEAQMVETS